MTQRRAVRRAIDAAIQATMHRQYAGKVAATADVVAEFLSALPLDLRVQFPRPLCKHEMERLIDAAIRMAALPKAWINDELRDLRDALDAVRPGWREAER